MKQANVQDTPKVLLFAASLVEKEFGSRAVMAGVSALFCMTLQGLVERGHINVVEQLLKKCGDELSNATGKLFTFKVEKPEVPANGG